jgi:hypothetical protein
VDTPDPSFVEDAAGLRQAMEYYADQGWTDGLPVVPVTESYLAEFLAFSGRDPDDVLLDMPHLRRPGASWAGRRGRPGRRCSTAPGASSRTGPSRPKLRHGNSGLGAAVPAR